MVSKQIFGHNIGGSHWTMRSADCVSHKSRALIQVINKQSIKLVLMYVLFANNLSLISLLS
jgi:hypothetical protein